MTRTMRMPERPVAAALPTEVSRRDVLRLMGGAGLAAAATVAIGRRAGAQDASPVPAAMPVVGPQADGSTLWKVGVGGMDMENGIEYHTFWPNDITINAGDSIWFAEDMPMFHTITFLGPDGQVPPIEFPDPETAGTAVAGPPKLILNPLFFTGTGPLVVDGTALVSTTVDVFGDPSVPWVFSFPAEGEFNFVCVPHASVMTGKVTVQAKGTAYPTDQATYDSESATRMADLQKVGMDEIAKYSTPAQTKKADSTTLWEVTLGAGGANPVRVQRFLPGEPEITAGDSINFKHESPGEPHTVSLVGNGETPPDDTLIEQFADGSPKAVQNMLTFLPQGGNTWSGTGWLNSGWMGIAELGLPSEFEILFDTAGDFVPYCILHGDNTGNGMAMKLSVKAAG